MMLTKQNLVTNSLINNILQKNGFSKKRRNIIANNLCEPNDLLSLIIMYVAISHLFQKNCLV